MTANELKEYAIEILTDAFKDMAETPDPDLVTEVINKLDDIALLISCR